MDEKKYKLNDELVSANQLIEAAKELDPSYAAEFLHTTSEAASILREDGNEVE